MHWFKDQWRHNPGGEFIFVDMGARYWGGKFDCDIKGLVEIRLPTFEKGKMVAEGDAPNFG